MKKRIIFAAVAVFILLSCVSCSDNPTDGQTDIPPTTNTGTVYTITDYYDENGGYSALGLALEEENAEKVLTVKADDIIIIGKNEYTVMAESLTLAFYTQPSLDEVIAWWTDYCQSRIERGEMK